MEAYRSEITLEEMGPYAIQTSELNHLLEYPVRLEFKPHRQQAVTYSNKIILTAPQQIVADQKDQKHDLSNWSKVILRRKNIKEFDDFIFIENQRKGLFHIYFSKKEYAEYFLQEIEKEIEY